LTHPAPDTPRTHTLILIPNHKSGTRIPGGDGGVAATAKRGVASLAARASGGGCRADLRHPCSGIEERGVEAARWHPRAAGCGASGGVPTVTGGHRAHHACSPAHIRPRPCAALAEASSSSCGVDSPFLVPGPCAAAAVAWAPPAGEHCCLTGRVRSSSSLSGGVEAVHAPASRLIGRFDIFW